MSAFVAVAVLLVFAALAFVLPPLLRARGATAGVSREAINISVYRDQLRELEADLAAGVVSEDRYEEARREIEHRLLEDASAGAQTEAPAQRSRRTAVFVGLAVPLLAVALYGATGTPEALDHERVATEHEHALDRQQMEALVERLAQKLRDSAEPNVEGWVMLGRSYNSMGRYAEAVEAYKTALKGGPPDARLLADYADALAMLQGRSLIGEPEKLIRQALKLDPQNIKALALSGTVAFDRQDYREAAAQWEKILALVPPDSEMARSIQGSVAEARSLGGIKGAPQPAAQSQPAPAQQPAAEARATGSAEGRVAGEVRLDPALASRIAPTDTVFIFARPAEGSRMPLAILRKPASELPAKFVLDDAMAMTPQAKLSAHPQVVIGARVSKSGSAMPQSGDLEGLSKPVKVGAAGTVIVIDRVLQ